jgi:Spy/CpxP family protein refolding chaperone
MKTSEQNVMQRTRTVPLAIGVLVACVGLGVVALAAQGAPQAGEVGGRGQMRRESVEERLARMTERLSLTEDQKEKIRPILGQEADQIKALRGNTSLSRQERRAKVREIRKSTHEQIVQVLTPEQREKMKEMRWHAREGREKRSQQPPATQ